MNYLYQICFCLSCVFSLQGQISLSAIGTPYNQDFSGLPTASDGGTITWVDNSSLAGFYVLPSAILFESSYTSMSNTGKPYIYKSGTDLSIGSRASGTSPNNNIYIGARFKNNTGTTIKSLEVGYYGEQWTIAENGSNVNTMQFHYQKSAGAITSPNSGSWTAVSALNFTQIWTSSQSASKGGTACTGTSNQCLALDGNNAANRVLNYAVFDVTINPGEEIMLRWYDKDDPSNDHHMQIDDLEVTPWDQPANIVLPISLTNFSAQCNGAGLQFSWSTSSERNNDFFTLEETTDGIGFQVIGKLKGAGNSDVQLDYTFDVPAGSGKYFRLKQTDYDGKSTYSGLIYANCAAENKIRIYPNPNNGNFYVDQVAEGSSARLFNELGQLIAEFTTGKAFENLGKGLYFVEVLDASGNRAVEKVTVF